MADYVKVDGVAAADIVKIDGVAVANIVKVDGATKPASGQTATRWVAAFDGVGAAWYIAYAAHSDRTSWTGTQCDSTHPDTYWLAYGKDGSGNAIWAATTQGSDMEIAYDGNNDVTDGSSWTKVTDDSDGTDIEKLWTIAWGNDVWIGAGIVQGVGSGLPEIYRSADGAASWVKIDLSSVSGISTTQAIYGLASDGAGNWMFGQGAKIFASTNDGSSWAEMTSYPGTAVADVGFTNSTWVVLGAANPGNVNTVGAAAFATEMGGGSAATWGEQDVDAGGGNTINVGQSGGTRSRMACGAGVVIVAHVTNTMAFDVNGATVSVRASGKVAVGNKATASGDPVINGTMNCIATDGNGVWLAGSDGGGDGGEVAESTDNGATWDRILNDFTFGAGNVNRKFEAIRANVYLPV